MHAILCEGRATHSRVARESAPPVSGALPSPGYLRWDAGDGHLLFACQLQLGTVHRYSIAHRYSTRVVLIFASSTYIKGLFRA